MSLNLKMTGDWSKAGIYLKNLSTKITPAFQLQLQEDGEFILEKIRDHVYRQDLDWTPLKDKTIELKGGDDTIYIQTGQLIDGMVVRQIKSTTKGSTIFVGASPWKKHGSVKMNDLMIWLEYGTDKIPPRPLIRPTYEEVQDIIREHWKDLFQEICKEV